MTEKNPRAARRRRLVLYTTLLLVGFGVAAGVVLRPRAGSFLSPGPLAAAHAHLEGEAHCADCHVARAGLSPQLCLDCHDTLATRLDRAQGFHAKLDLERTACNRCHPEHLGVDVALIRWPVADAPFQPAARGAADEDAFPHAAATGFALDGAHAQVKCDGCHRPSLLADAKVLEFVGQRRTYLGAPKDCGGCHADAHAPTLGADCGACHEAAAWTPATRFAHERTRYPLVGKHAEAKCDACHLVAALAALPPPAPKPVPTFEALVATARPRPFRGGFGAVEPSSGDALPACRACHANPHREAAASSFGRCEDCHTPHAWQSAGQTAQGAAFDHATTGFLLDGAHGRVTCVACHGPKLDLAARTSCQACHQDIHKGAFDREMAAASRTCEACHSTAAWKPSAYVTARHPLPLIEGHAVKCEDCHGTERRAFPRLPARAPATIGPLDQSCVACHQDVHAGKLGQDCASCHGFKKFTLAELSVAAHADIGFPIRDAHLEATCEGCHGARTPQGGLRQLALAEARTQGCVACHQDDDPHRGQLTPDCKACHGEVAWTPSSYDEARHQRARLPLQGAHRAVPCEACHARDVAPAPLQQRFRWGDGEGALRCAGCHSRDDPHRGQFTQQDCVSCHSQDRWLPSTFSRSTHARTGFRLEGPHDRACRACHVPGPGDAIVYVGTPTACAGCHVDPHLGQFADRGGPDGCGRCHPPDDWAPTRFDHGAADVRFHLTGKHAAVECEACHRPATRQMTDGTTREVKHYFPMAQRACDDCHQNPHAPRQR